MTSDAVFSPQPRTPRRWSAALPRTAALAAGLAGLLAGTAQAGPVVQTGSTYSVYLNQASTASGAARYISRFDGVAESFAHGTASLSINDAQLDLNGGRHAIDITLDFSGGDPFPVASSVTGIGVGVGTSVAAGDVLNLVEPVALTAAQVYARFADGSESDYDALPLFSPLGTSTQPWTGDMFNGYFLGLPWSGRGLTQLRVHFETASLNAVPTPGTVPLMALGLLTLALRMPRRRGA